MVVTVAIFAALVLAFATTARGLGRASLTAPIVFVTAGAVLGATGALTTQGAVGPRGYVTPLTLLTEVTLALILFHDAAQVRPRQIAAERGPVLRLLLLGLPLTIGAGYLATRALFPEWPVMVALLLAASLAPTDAGLGTATVLNPAVPVRVRRILNIESGLNDGLTTPVVLFAIASIAGSERLAQPGTLGDAVVQLLVGIGVGVAVGGIGGRLLGWSRRHGLSGPSMRALGVLTLPVLAYVGAELVDGNTFVAAFTAGTAFAAARWVAAEDSVLDLTEVVSEPLGFAVWLIIGVVAFPFVRTSVGWREVALALLSLTVLRMGPVALALLGSGLRPTTVAFVGWFGPRGLASVVFALLAVENLDPDRALRSAVSTIALTVLLSVVAHGLSADVLARRYGAWIDRTRPTAETAPGTEPHVRGARLRGQLPPDDRAAG